MKIGIFDSGLGGLVILRAVRRVFPTYDYIYLGDTKNLPYGNKGKNEIYKKSVKAVEYLFENDCALVIVACNTVSAQALRHIQQEWLPKSSFNKRRILGVIRPTVEIVGLDNKIIKNVGLIGTEYTVNSTAYQQELQKILALRSLSEGGNPKIKLIARATPKLVSMIEEGKVDQEILENYLLPFKNSDALILGCTHFGFLKKNIAKILNTKVKIIAQEDLLPAKLKSYLKDHPEIEKNISTSKKVEILVTKLNSRYQILAQKWFGKNIKPKLVKV